jgi:serine/threonine protein kinase
MLKMCQICIVCYIMHSLCIAYYICLCLLLYIILKYIVLEKNSFLIFTPTHDPYSAVRYMHSRGIIHRDIKPEILIIKNNYLKDEIQIKIVDLGFAVLERKLENNTSNLLYGTAG